MRQKQFLLDDNNVHVIWKALHDSEEKLQRIIDSGDPDNDEVIFASNDIVYLRGFIRWFEQEARTTFPNNIFDLTDKVI